MDDTTSATGVKSKIENFLDIAGYIAVRDPWEFPGWSSKRSKDEYDKAALSKLHLTGFGEDTLEEIHSKYCISPLRTTQDVWKILQYPHNPRGPNRDSARYREEHLTALALPYPDLQRPGETLPYERMIRVRPAVAVASWSREKGFHERKYEQPNYKEGRSASEPYFLVQRNSWDKIYDATMPLLFVEGELKSAALGLADFAAIGFGGVSLWRAPKKAGKDVLHESLNPKTPWAIPIGRPIHLITDLNYRNNISISREFKLFGQKLMIAGAPPPRIVILPYGNWNGVDDYITAKLGPKWAKDLEGRRKAHELVVDLIENGDHETIRDDSHYVPTDTTRCRNRILESLSRPNHFAVVVNNPTNWAIYNGAGRYVSEDVCFTLGGTSGKMAKPSAFLRKLIEDDYEMGIRLHGEEGHAIPKQGFKGMPTDHPNSVLAKVDTYLPRVDDNSLIEEFEGVAKGDVCLRINGALVNLTRAFKVGLSWPERSQWLLPPDYRWFSLSALDVSLSNIVDEPKCPLFLEFLANAFEGDKEKIDCLQLWFGKIVTSPLLFKLQQFLCLYGAAGAGKSTITRILTKMLGESEVEMMRSTQGSRFELGGVVGKKLLLFAEAMDGSDKGLKQSLVTAIKSITGGDSITIERKGKDPVSVNVTPEVLLVSNNAPGMLMDAEAFRRRAVFLSTTKMIVNPSARAEAEMMLELPGIFVWALRGAMSLYFNTDWKIETPAACMADLEEAIEDVSPEAAFVRSRVAKIDNKDVILTRDQLEDAFREWLSETNRRGHDVQPKVLTRLVREIHGVGSETMRNPLNKSQLVRGFRGLKVRETDLRV